jgi:beta-phosphoglucomutase family hydrolase
METMSDIGAIFDWDGVVVDSSAAHAQSWVRLAAEEGRVLPEDHFRKGFGMKNEVIIPRLLGWSETPAEITRLSLRKEALYREIIRETNVAALPGVRTWLQRLAEAGVPCVIGSSTHRLNIEFTLPVIGLRDFFSDMVTAENVSHGKPDPEVFLLAAQRIGVPPERCVVFEDALAGIEAARRGGMKVVAVATTHAREALQVADIVVDALDELGVDQLRDLVGR